MEIDTEESLRALRRFSDELEAFIDDVKNSEPTITSDVLGEAFTDKARTIALQLRAIQYENLGRSITLINAAKKAQAQIVELRSQEGVNAGVLGAIDVKGGR